MKYELTELQTCYFYGVLYVNKLIILFNIYIHKAGNGNTCILLPRVIEVIKYRKRTPKENPKQQNCKCCRLGLIEPDHGRQWKVQATVHTP